MSNIFVGIDPGITGAVAWLEEIKRGSKTILICDIVFIPTKAITKTKREIDYSTLFGVLKDCPPTFLMLEKASAMPKQGVVSMFRYGQAYGAIIMAIEALGIPYEVVHPRTWKAAMLSGMPKGKESSVIRAKGLFPNSTEFLKLKKDHNKAEALLLAEYGRRRYMGFRYTGG